MKIYSFKLEPDKLSQSNVNSSSNHSLLFDKYEKEKNNSRKSFYSDSSNNIIDYIKSDVCLGNNLIIIFSIVNNVIIFSRYLGQDSKYNYYKMRIKIVLKYKELDIYKVNKVIEEISYLNSLTDYLSKKYVVFSGEDLFLLDENFKINEINIKINEKLKVSVCNKDNKKFFDCSKKDEHNRYLKLYKEKNNKSMNINSTNIIYKKKSCQGINALKYSLQNKNNNKQIDNNISYNYIRIKINKKENNNESFDSERNKSNLNKIKNNNNEDIDDDEENEINDTWEKTDENTNQNEDIRQNNNHNNIHSSSTSNSNNSTSNTNNKCIINKLEKIKVIKKKPSKEESNKNQYIKNLSNDENENDILRARKDINNNNNNNTNQNSDENHNNKTEQNMNKAQNDDSYYYYQYMKYDPFGYYSYNPYNGFPNDKLYYLNSPYPYNYNSFTPERNFNNNKYNCNNNNGNKYNNIIGCNYINNSTWSPNNGN